MWIILFFSLIASANEKRVCDLSVVKELCEYAQSQTSEEFLVLSNGFKSKNPMYVPYTKVDPNAEEKINASLDSQVEKEVETLRAINEAGAALNLSDKFKMSFIKYLSNAMEESSSDSSDYYGSKIRLPLPMNDENAKFQTVTTAQLREIFSKFPEASKKRLIDLHKQKAVEHGPYMSAYIYSQSGQPGSENQVVAKDKRRVEQLMSQVQKDLVISLSQGQSRDKLSPELKSLIKKIESVKIYHGDHFKLSTSKYCRDNAKNGFYDPTDHSMNICPAYYAESDLNFVKIIAHEIGHSIDPCNSKFELLNKPGADGKLVHFLRVPNHAIYDEGKVEASGIPTELYPLNDVKKCMVNNMRVRDLTDADYEAIAFMESRYSKSELDLTDKVAEALRENVSNTLKSNNNCTETRFINTEINEAMSDVFGEIALSYHLKRQPLKSKNDGINAMSLSYNFPMKCGEVKPSEGLSAHRDVEPKFIAISRFQKMIEVHPGKDDRAEKFAIQQPEVAKLLGCQRNPKYICYDKYLAGNVDTKKSSKPLDTREGVK